MTDDHRHLYVGAGADGARRSAQIDRDELDTLTTDDPRRPGLEESAARWDRQAERLDYVKHTAIEELTDAELDNELEQDAMPADLHDALLEERRRRRKARAEHQAEAREVEEHQERKHRGRLQGMMEGGCLDQWTE